MATKPKIRIFLSEDMRRSIQTKIESQEMVRLFHSDVARNAVLESSEQIRSLAKERQEERHIDQIVRSMPVQV